MAELILNSDTQLVTVDDASPTISVLWDRAVQQAVINTTPGPTIASRAYSMVHTAMFDAWAAYDLTAIGTQLGDDLQRPAEEVTEENKQEAMSYAAYRVLEDLFPSQTDVFDALMAELGFDPENRITDTNTAAGVGNISAQALLDFRRNDGSNQLGNDPNGDGTPYSDTTNYEPGNAPGATIDIELWTPEFVPIVDPTGSVQQFLTPQWGEVIPFALDSGAEFRPIAPEPFLLTEGEFDLSAQTITLEDGSVLDINEVRGSPVVSRQGLSDPSLIGTVINPEFINQAAELIEVSAGLTDEQKLIAEFWEDGGGTSFPPGTWMTFGQFVSARDDHSLDDDAQLFFALGNAVFDAGVATWEAKVFYDYNRPVRTIRELGELGLIGEFNSDLGGFAIEAWQPNLGTQTILASDFLTYQTPGSDPSPPFAEYTSGHSAFSAAGAEVLRLFTDSDDFGAAVTLAPGESRFEPGITPAEEVTLEWDTFSEAADEAGISRIYGGIHFEDGDLNSRSLGTEVGNAVFEQAQFFINGGELSEPLLDTPIFRLQNNQTPGTYLYTGEEERNNILANFDYVDEGIAFNAAVEADEELIPLYRFQSNTNPEAYLWVGESERASIQSDENLSQAFTEEGLAFYAYGAGAGQATEFYRFRNLNVVGSYLYATGVERDNIIANFSDSYLEEGIAFEAVT